LVRGSVPRTDQRMAKKTAGGALAKRPLEQTRTSGPTCLLAMGRSVWTVASKRACRASTCRPRKRSHDRAWSRAGMMMRSSSSKLSSVPRRDDDDLDMRVPSDGPGGLLEDLYVRAPSDPPGWLLVLHVRVPSDGLELVVAGGANGATPEEERKRIGAGAAVAAGAAGVRRNLQACRIHDTALMLCGSAGS